MCGECIAKCILVIINKLVVLVGLLLIGVGALFNWGTPVLLSNPAFKGILSSISAISKAAGGPDLASLTLDFSRLLGSAALVLMCVGGALAIIGVVGCVGACCKSKPFLTVYIVIILVFLVIVIGTLVGVFAARSKIETAVKVELKASITKEYVSASSKDLASVAWNFVMIGLKCCGVDGNQDFQGAQKWNNSRPIKIGMATNVVNLTTPVMCCKTSGVFPNLTVTDMTCVVNATAANSNYKQGCFKVLMALVDQHSYSVIMVAVCLILFMMLIIAMSCMLMKETDKVSPA